MVLLLKLSAHNKLIDIEKKSKCVFYSSFCCGLLEVTHPLKFAVWNLPQENSGHEKIWLCLRRSALWLLARKQQANKHLYIYVWNLADSTRKPIFRFESSWKCRVKFTYLPIGGAKASPRQVADAYQTLLHHQSPIYVFFKKTFDYLYVVNKTMWLILLSVLL